MTKFKTYRYSKICKCIFYLLFYYSITMTWVSFFLFAKQNIFLISFCCLLAKVFSHKNELLFFFSRKIFPWKLFQIHQTRKFLSKILRFFFFFFFFFFGTRKFLPLKQFENKVFYEKTMSKNDYHHVAGFLETYFLFKSHSFSSKKPI